MIDVNDLLDVKASELKEGDVILVVDNKIHRWEKVTHVRSTQTGIEVATCDFPRYAPDHIFLVKKEES